MLLLSSKNYVYQCINCNACMHKVHALVNFLLILACNDLMHLRIWTCDGNNQIEPYKMEKLKFWDKPYKPERREYWFDIVNVDTFFYKFGQSRGTLTSDKT